MCRAVKGTGIYHKEISIKLKYGFWREVQKLHFFLFAENLVRDINQ